MTLPALDASRAFVAVAVALVVSALVLPKVDAWLARRRWARQKPENHLAVVRRMQRTPAPAAVSPLDDYRERHCEVGEE